LSPGTPGACPAGAFADDMVDKEMDWPTVIAVADDHYVLPLMHFMLQRKGLTRHLPEGVRDTLAELFQLNLARNEQLRHQLIDVILQLNGAGITPLLLKGAVALMGQLYPDPGCRMMGDLDLLLPEGELHTGARVLEAAGYQTMGEPAKQHHLPCLEHPEHVGRLELHWEIVHTRHRKLLSGASMLAKAIPVENDGLRYNLGTGQHMAMHNIIHHQLHDAGYRFRAFKLYQVYDLVRLMRMPSSNIAWDRLFRHFDRQGYGAAVGAYFMLIRQLFGLPLPDGIRTTVFAHIGFRLVLTRLKPPALLRGRPLTLLGQLPFPHNTRQLVKVLTAPGSYKQGIDSVKAVLMKRL
jgi:hypothetical protein